MVCLTLVMGCSIQPEGLPTLSGIMYIIFHLHATEEGPWYHCADFTPLPSLPPFFCFPVLLPLLPQTHMSWQMNWASLSLVTPTAWKSVLEPWRWSFIGEASSNSYQSGLKGCGWWVLRGRQRSGISEGSAKEWNVRGNCMREWSVWSVREECEGVECECGVWECGMWERGVRVCTNPSSLSHNSFYLTCEEGVVCGNKTNWH